MTVSRYSSCRFAGILGLLGMLLWAGNANAYCRATTISPPLGYDPVAQGCFTSDADGGPLPLLFWRNQCVSYSFQSQGGKDISPADATRVAAQAFSTWTSAPCPGGVPTIEADPYPAVECDNPRQPGHGNMIIFRNDVWPYEDDASNTLGYTTLTIARATGEILGAAIEINSADYRIVADADAGAGDASATKTYDFASILTHEAGHFLGLAHSEQQTAVMYAHYQPGSTVLTPDDVQGICSIYSPEGTRNTSNGPVAAMTCMPAPRLGWASDCASIDSGAPVGSGALPDAGADDPPCVIPSACSMSRTPGSGGVGLTSCALAVCGLGGALARRARRGSPTGPAGSPRTKTPRRAPAAASLLGVSLALLGASAINAKDARASVSTAVFFEQLVQEASAVAVVTRVAQHALWEGDHIVTYTRLRVDRLVAGRLPDEVWVRTLGGTVGDLAQIVEGQATFALDQPSLVFLRPHVGPTALPPAGSFVVAARAQGQFPIAVDRDHLPRLAIAADIGALVPPPPSQQNRASIGLPAGNAPRFARDVLEGRPLEDAAREIAAAWSRAH